MLTFNRKINVSIAWGVIVLVVGYIFNPVLFYFFSFFLFQIISPANTSFIFDNPFFPIIQIVSLVMSNLVYLAAGFIVGRTIRNKGFLYGMIPGALYSALSILLFIGLITFAGPEIFGPVFKSKQNNDLILKNITSSFISGIQITLLTGLGGWLGEWSLKTNSKKGNYGK
jgi:hypothetical protein